MNSKCNYCEAFDIYLLDLDGTVIDSGKGITNSIVYAFNQLELKVPDAATLRRFIGPPLMESFTRICGFDEETAKAGVEAYRKHYRAGSMYDNEVYDGVEEFLRRLVNAGKKVILATSKPEEFAVKILDNLGLAKYFDVICGSDLQGKRDTKWEVIVEALDRAGVTDLSKVVMIGDRKYDVIGAHKVGVKCIGILYGYGSRDEFEKANADYIEEKLSDIL